ncbi:MAG: SHOCT domain-containing protein [Micromonosporaceae bacterium]
MMYEFGYGGFWMMLMPLLWILLIGLAVWAVIRFTGSPTPGAPRGESPQEILDRRLANGEIEPGQYDEARARLSRTGTTSR